MALFRPLVLMYHAVSDGWSDPLAVRVADFEDQMRSLASRGYEGATWRELLESPKRGKLLHITFDDGLRSVQNALPILDELGLPCTIFVCTNFARAGSGLSIPALSSRSQGDELATMDWPTLQNIARERLVEIGSHGCGHLDLVRLSDAELHSELCDSKAEIEDNVGRACPTLAYPFGSQDERVRRAAALAGYAAAFAAPGTSLRVDPLQIPRTGIWRDEPPLRQRVRTNFPARVILEHRR